MAVARHRPTLSSPRLAAWAPWITLAVGTALVALPAVLVAVRVNGLASLDELVYRVSAATYTEGLPGSIIHDPVARGSARLYSLVIAPFFGLLAGDDALRAARGLNGVLFALASVPVALIARRLTGSSWAAVAAGLLAVAVPWLTVATLLFSESLAYLLFCWTVYAMLVTLARPSPGKDLLVLALMVALVGTRVQFVALPVAWLVIVALRGRGAQRRELARRHPFLLGVVALGVLVGAMIVAAGQLDRLIDSVGGPYAEIRQRGRPPADIGLAFGYHGGMLVAGLGIVPGILMLAWFAEVLRRRPGGEEQRFVVLALAVLGALFFVTISAQNGWADGRAEERYYLYAVPFVWCAAVAAARTAAIRSATIVRAGVAVALVLVLVPLNVTLENNQAIYGPVGPSLSWIGNEVGTALAGIVGWNAGLTPRDQLFLLALALTALTAWVWHRHPVRRGLLLAVPAVLQVGLAAFAITAVAGGIGGVAGSPKGDVEGRAWVDHALGERRASLAENRRAGDVNPYIDLVLWNDQVRDRYRVPSMLIPDPPFPVGSTPVRSVEIGDDLRFSDPAPQRLVVADRGSVLWQPEGELLATSPDGEHELLDLGAEPRARWAARGLDGDGHVSKRAELLLRGGNQVALHVAAAGPGLESQITIRMAPRRYTVTFPGPEREIWLSACGRTGVVRGSITPDRLATTFDKRQSAAMVTRARVVPCDR
jgi:hypothetical protein